MAIKGGKAAAGRGHKGSRPAFAKGATSKAGVGGGSYRMKGTGPIPGANTQTGIGPIVKG